MAVHTPHGLAGLQARPELDSFTMVCTEIGMLENPKEGVVLK